MTENYPHKLKISLKRVQTFIFEVPKLKAMLGANAMLGETMRNVLAELIGNSGQRLDWPDDILLTPATCDPLTEDVYKRQAANQPEACAEILSNMPACAAQGI